MNNRLEEPQIVAEAREAQKGWNWFLELLAFIGVFAVSGIATTLVLVAGIAVLCLMKKKEA